MGQGADVAGVDGQLMTEGGIFQGDLLVATEHENEESKRQEECVQHEAITVLPSLWAGTCSARFLCPKQF